MASSFLKVHGSGGARALAWTEKGVVTAGLCDGSLVLAAVDGAQPRVAKSIPRCHVAGFGSMAADHGLNRVVCIGLDGDLQVWSMDEAPERDARALPGLNEGRPGLLKLDHATLDVASVVAHSPILPQFAIGGVGGRVTLVDAASGSSLGSVLLPCGGAAVLALAYAPDGTKVAAACDSGGLWVLDAEAGLATLGSAAPHALPVRGVAWSHDGAQLVTASDDGRVGVLDASTLAAGGGAAAVTYLAGHSHWVTGVAASPDKHLVASVSADRSCRLWDTRTRECVHVFGGHADKLWAVTFSPAGDKLATVSEGGVLGVFSVAAVV